MDIQTVITSISLGLLATTSPCVLPLYPGFLAYLAGTQEDFSQNKGRYLLGIFVLAGILLMMLILGLLITLLSVSIGKALSLIIPLADLLIIMLGLFLVFNINPFKTLPQINAPIVSHPYANAFLYGLLYGPIALPCSGPLVVGIFAFSLTVGEALSKLSVFLWFGLGFGIPLLLLTLLSGATQRSLTHWFARNAQRVNLVGGVLLVSVGIYDLAQNWGMIRAFWT
jgi:cytochrome c-type biogenesis protein